MSIFVILRRSQCRLQISLTAASSLQSSIVRTQSPQHHYHTTITTSPIPQHQVVRSTPKYNDAKIFGHHNCLRLHQILNIKLSIIFFILHPHTHMGLEFIPPIFRYILSIYVHSHFMYIIYVYIKILSKNCSLCSHDQNINWFSQSMSTSNPVDHKL